ncbi:MAG TPA: sigma-70 family RNA polymerase sigma factor [Lacipirellulaceae bacterium]|nr:sigma-70 family RNA polymerase sigma factor [Lacipirellulaceae bacterium]
MSGRQETNWDAIVADHGCAVWETLWRLLGNRADAEDCFQETFVAAWKFSRRQTVECWAALLCSLATARAIDRLRERYRLFRNHGHDAASKRMVGPSAAEAVSTAAGPVEQAVAAELSDRLRAALGQLSEKQAEIFSLHVLSGWSQREIAERLKMTDNYVGVTIYRARQQLQQLLRADG